MDDSDHVQPNSYHVQAASVEENVYNDVSVDEEDEIYDGKNSEELDDVSVYAPSDELWSIHSDLDDKIHIPCKKSEFIARSEMGEKEKILMVGIEFATFAEFKDVLREHAIKNKYDIKFVKNDGKRVTCICRNECGRRIHASKRKLNGAIVISTFNDEHTCSEVQTSRLATSSHLAKKYVHKFRRDPEWKNSDLIDQITDDLNLLVLETNPGSFTKVDAFSKPDGKSTRFERLFFSLNTMWRGFKEGCRPFIGLDGCFLKTHYNQHLLSAIGRDGDNSFYPIAIGIVEAETKETWDWFLDNLMDLFCANKEITFILDR
ncbi:uncharacterized protein LOC132281851 [Cornus florida]|uniref:uncharacterized protein LOC132281851 n=1 Tax=Cornus florida TaxID=4283 RepID=UPI00289C3BF6|nr:uncharacterized protein LOC132281851 [Cornus florida]